MSVWLGAVAIVAGAWLAIATKTNPDRPWPSVGVLGGDYVFAGILVLVGLVVIAQRVAG